MMTKFELYKSAGDAAAATLGTGGANDLTELGAQGRALEVFREGNGQDAEWPFWKQVFDERREFFRQLRGQTAPSEPTDAETLTS